LLVINLKEWMDRVGSDRRKSYPVEDVFCRTSVTVHEAVAIMLGYADGPISMRSLNRFPSDEEMEALRDIPYYVHEGWAEERESLEGECDSAEKAGLSEESINESREALERFELEVNEAKRWLCEIEDELGKGDASGLRLDNKRSNEHFTYITLWSLKEWAEEKNYAMDLFPLAVVGEHVPRLRAQEAAILKALKSKGYDPKMLPPYKKGESEVKREMYELLNGTKYFIGDSVFGKAWERMRKAGGLADAPTSSST